MQTRSPWLRSVLACLILLAGSQMVVPAVEAWSHSGHRWITAAAVESLSVEGLEWIATEKIAIVEASVQPDLMRSRELPELRAVEAPQHFIDLELLEGEDLPDERWKYVELLRQMASIRGGPLRPGADVTQVGTIPYALVESTQRLAAILAQLRLRPDEAFLRSMAAQQMGMLAHYAQDLCQPLHTTMHHDGRAREDGSSPHSGLHQQVDALIRWVPSRDGPGATRTPQLEDPLFPSIVEALLESHSQVDRVYELSGQLDAMESTGRADPGLVAFAAERYRRAVDLTADLIYTAWRLSAAVAVPSWAQEENPTRSEPR